MSNVFDVLKERGFIYQNTDEIALREILNSPQTFYVGFDATATSLHVGSLICLMAIKHLQNHGHKPIILIGDGTALIGDPSGKTKTRTMLLEHEIEENAVNLINQIEDLFVDNYVIVRNSFHLKGLDYLKFLRNIGKYFSVNKMLSYDNYAKRLEIGLSFIEFNYQVLQAYDFLELYQTRGCKIQVGGSDQWGNIVAGIDLIRRVEQADTYGITFPLLTDSNGDKFGKSEGTPIWLNSEMTAPFDFYQFWINVDDKDVERYLKLFTFIDISEIERVTKDDIRSAKKLLAKSVTEIVHGNDVAIGIEKVSGQLYSTYREEGCYKDMVPVAVLSPDEFKLTITDILFLSKMASSKAEARRLIEQGGVSIDGVKVSDIKTVFDRTVNELGWCLIKVGKKNIKRIIKGE